MMNKIEYLALKVAEESGELAQEAGKLGVFGPNSVSPYNNHSNIVNLRNELRDVVTVAMMLIHELGHDIKIDYSLVSSDKMKRVNHYYDQRKRQLGGDCKETTHW